MADKKKILFLHNSLDIGGAEKLRLMLLSNIDRQRYDMRLCCIKRKGIIGEAIEKLGYKVDELKLDPGPKNITTTYSLIRYLRNQKIDILQTSLFNSNFHGRIAAMACHTPCVITEEHSEHYQYQNFKHLFYILSDFLLSKMTKFIICCSETVRRDIMRAERLPKEKLITVTNCIDPSFYGVKESRELLRKRYNIGDEEIVIITVASFANKKGHKFLIEALAGLKDSGFGFKCFLAGQGPLEDSLKSKVECLKLDDRVVFLGNVEGIEDYLNASDIFILPSLKEGLPISLIEAMFMGLGCIVTDVGGNRELIEDYVNGIIIPPADSKKLKEAILFYFKNKASIREFGDRCKNVIKGGYLIDKYVAKFYNVWDNVDGKE